jgi:uncharacterized protein YajQ (UPF0234 family)
MISSGDEFRPQCRPSGPETTDFGVRPAITAHQRITMAKKNSFDVSTGVDLQEVDNAVNQAHKEIATRYDFKGTDCTVDFDRSGSAIKLEADDEYRLTAVLQIVREKLSRRGVPVKNLDQGGVEIGSLGRARQTVGLKQGIDQETAKKMVKAVKDHGFKKVQVQIQADELRVTSPSKDELQQVMAFMKGEDWGVELQFGNYR